MSLQDSFLQCSVIFLGLYWINLYLICFLGNPRYCYSLGIIVFSLQKLTFCNIFVITRDILLKLRACDHYSSKGDNSKYFFFQNYVPFSIQTFYPLSNTPQLSVVILMHCSCLNTRLLIRKLRFDSY